ncbi:unnamed protein product [Caenorhabditis angaria]|uniref:NPHP4 C2-like domain-containing protein n=1 Tax=Caenorhabditis angaria TaxID=860376 RepID=A0A9P1IVH8_9PELO|nr:unnamed protein product [Caenorhabditis angaria]
MDDIPGILATENDPFLHHPQIDPQISASIDEVTVTFGPNAQKIEKMIIDEVLHDWNLKENAQFLAENLKISERRLKIGVHNGFSYLSEPISINLNASNSNILTNTSSLKKRRALSSNDLRNGPVSLFVNSRISIPNICEDPRVALIFLVEYTFAYEDRRKFSQQPILIGWGAWKPFGEEAAGSRHNVLASVSLVGGPRPNPEGALCFRNLLHLRQSDDSVFTESQPQITINFAFFLDQLRAESRITSLGDGPISARKSPKPKPKKLEPEPEETKILSSTKLPEISARSVNSELEILEISKDLEAFLEPLKQPEVGPESPVIYRIPEEKPQNFSRILHGLYTRLEFLRILDRNSEQPEIQDVNLKILSNFTVEKLDRLDIQHIFFQFCAMKKFEFAAEDTTVTRVFFSINFYRFPEMITESMILKQFEKSEPAALLRHDGKPGLVSKYIMDSDEDRVEFLEFLNSSHATIHIWDSDSLLLIGTCHVPLNNLMRRGKEAVQLFVQLPIFGIEPTNSRPVGMLAMKLANVGWPTTGGGRDKVGRDVEENEASILRPNMDMLET